MPRVYAAARAHAVTQNTQCTQNTQNTQKYSKSHENSSRVIKILIIKYVCTPYKIEKRG